MHVCAHISLDALVRSTGCRRWRPVLSRSLAYACGHHHVPTQLIRAWSGSFELTDAQGRQCFGTAAIIPSGCHHSIRIVEPCSGFLLFIDPRTVVGKQLSTMADGTDDVRRWFAAGEVLQNWTRLNFLVRQSFSRI